MVNYTNYYRHSTLSLIKGDTKTLNLTIIKLKHYAPLVLIICGILKLVGLKITWLFVSACVGIPIAITAIIAIIFVAKDEFGTLKKEAENQIFPLDINPIIKYYGR